MSQIKRIIYLQPFITLSRCRPAQRIFSFLKLIKILKEDALKSMKRKYEDSRDLHNVDFRPALICPLFNTQQLQYAGYFSHFITYTKMRSSNDRMQLLKINDLKLYNPSKKPCRSQRWTRLLSVAFHSVNGCCKSISFQPVIEIMVELLKCHYFYQV